MLADTLGDVKALTEPVSLGVTLLLAELVGVGEAEPVTDGDDDRVEKMVSDALADSVGDAGTDAVTDGDADAVSEMDTDAEAAVLGDGDGDADIKDEPLGDAATEGERLGD